MTATPLFPDFESLGDGASYAEKIREVTPHNALFDDFNIDDLKQLGPFMQVYRAPPHGVIISEGDHGDFMVFIIDGEVDVTKKDRWEVVKRIAVVLPGQALGEMSMIDGEARFATCGDRGDHLCGADAPGAAGIDQSPAAYCRQDHDETGVHAIPALAPDQRQAG